MSAASDCPARALILAAGIGRRLGAGDRSPPKALLEFAGRSLLARHVALLRGRGVADITVVIGHEAERIRAEIATIGCAQPLHLVVNPDYRAGSVVSLWAGREVLRDGRPVLLMDADVLYDRRLIARLIASEQPNCLLLDRRIEPGEEPVKLCVADGRIVDFGKRPSVPHDWHGESVGFFRLTPQAAAELADLAERYVTSGRRHAEYEEPIRDMILQSEHRFGFEDITGLPWTEIDFPEDVETARALLPQLVA